MTNFIRFYVSTWPDFLDEIYFGGPNEIDPTGKN